jgi:antitoxin ChpS
METVLRNFGNSVGLVIPKPVREALHLNAGQSVILEQTADGLLVRPRATKYNLDELLAQCDAKAPLPKEAKEWLDSPAAGNEVW